MSHKKWFIWNESLNSIICSFNQTVNNEDWLESYLSLLRILNKLNYLAFAIFKLQYFIVCIKKSSKNVEPRREILSIALNCTENCNPNKIIFENHKSLYICNMKMDNFSQIRWNKSKVVFFVVVVVLDVIRSI